MSKLAIEILNDYPLATETARDWFLKKMIESRDFDNPIYKELNSRVRMHFTCRCIPFPDCFYDSVSGI